MREIEKMANDKKTIHRVSFRTPEFEIHPIPISMDSDSVNVRSRHWELFALDSFRFRARIQQVDPFITRCLARVHREKMMDYIQQRV